MNINKITDRSFTSTWLSFWSNLVNLITDSTDLENFNFQSIKCVLQGGGDGVSTKHGAWNTQRNYLYIHFWGNGSFVLNISMQAYKSGLTTVQKQAWGKNKDCPKIILYIHYAVQWLLCKLQIVIFHKTGTLIINFRLRDKF